MKEHKDEWKPVEKEFYLELDKKWKENNHNKAWVRMYEKIKEDLLGRTNQYQWRWSGNELEIRKLRHKIEGVRI